MISDVELVHMAQEMMQRAYAPYSNYRVGAALLCADGSVYTGCNVECASYGGTICAERVAAVKAISEGNHEFVKLAVISADENLCTPCGICRQFLMEFAPDLTVLCANGQEEFRAISLADLLPCAFSGEQLQEHGK